MYEELDESAKDGEKKVFIDLIVLIEKNIKVIRLLLHVLLDDNMMCSNGFILFCYHNDPPGW